MTKKYNPRTFLADARSMRESKMDGAVFVIAGVVSLFICCIGFAIFLNKKKSYFLSNAWFVVSAAVLYVIMLTSYNFGTGSIATDETVMHENLEFAVPYENLGSAKVGENFVVIIRKKGSGTVKAYFFLKLPPKQFVKMRVDKEIIYYPHARLARSLNRALQLPYEPSSKTPKTK